MCDSSILEEGDQLQELAGHKEPVVEISEIITRPKRFSRSLSLRPSSGSIQNLYIAPRSSIALPPYSIENWTHDDVCLWLSTLSLGRMKTQYVETFRVEKVTGKELVNVDHDVLLDFDITSKLHRNRIITAVAEVTRDQGYTPSQVNVDNQELSPAKMNLSQLRVYCMRKAMDCSDIEEKILKFEAELRKNCRRGGAGKDIQTRVQEYGLQLYRQKAKNADYDWRAHKPPDFEKMDILALEEFCRENQIYIADIHELAHTKGIHKPNSLRQRLRSYRTVEEDDYTRILTEARKQQTVRAKNLIGVAESLSKCELPKSIRKLDLVRKQFQILPKIIQEFKETRESKILIFGEVSSGKSTFVNLLVERDKNVLYVDPKSGSTTTLCEIHYSETPHLVTYSKKTKNKKMHNLDDILHEDTDPSVVIKHFIAEDSKTADFEPTYSKVEVHWPAKLLKPGIVLIDSPGLNEARLGQSEQWWIESVRQTVSKSLAAICVISCTPGVTEQITGCLQQIKKAHMDLFGEFRPNSIFFVVTKLDKETPSDRETLLYDIREKLGIVVPECDLDSHLVDINLVEATRVQRLNMRSPAHSRILKMLAYYFSDTFDISILVSWTKLAQSVQTIRRVVQAEVRSVTKKPEELFKLCAESTEKLAGLQLEVEEVNKSLAQLIKQTSEELVTTVRHYLKESRDAIIQCTILGVPVVSRLQRRRESFLTAKVREAFDNALRKQIIELEKESKVFEKTKQFVRDAVDERCGDILVDLDKIRNSLIHAEEREMSIGHYSRSARMSDRLYQRLDNFTRGALGVGISGIAMIAGGIGLGVGAAIWPVVLGVAGIAGITLGVLWIVKNNPGLHTEQFATNYAQKTLDTITDSNDIIRKTVLFEELKTLKSITTSRLAYLDQQVLHNMELIQLNQARSRQDVTINQGQIDSTLKICRDANWTIDEQSEKLWRFYFIDLYKYSIDYDQLTNKKPISGGSTSTVDQYMFVLPSENDKKEDREIAVAVKTFDVNNCSFASFAQEEQNLRLMAEYECGLKFYGTCFNEGQVHLVLEYAEGGSLRGWIDDRRKKEVPMGAVIDMALQVSAGLQCMHELRIIHRDLKPENILIKNDGKLKIADLGLSKSVDEVGATICGSQVYMAPEVLDNLYTLKADIYSFGIILWEMWHKQLPYFDVTGSILFQVTKHRIRPTVAGDCPHWFKSLFSLCWSHNPFERPTWDFIIEQLTEMKVDWIKHGDVI